MLNIQVIDDADNCTFSVFQVTEAEFKMIFPDVGQDIEFVEDFFTRLGEEKAAKILELVWERPILKNKAQGIHGYLFYGFKAKQHHFPATKCEKDWNVSSLNPAQQIIYR